MLTAAQAAGISEISVYTSSALAAVKLIAVLQALTKNWQDLFESC